MQTIILNGTSSAGKSSIARAIQNSSPVPFLHISLDAFVNMFRWDAIHGDELRRECHRVGVSNFHRSLPILVASRFHAIIDHVFECQEWFEECLFELRDQKVFLVGVICPLEVLRERELLRADRRIGLAEFQYPLVHKNRSYDFEVDTSISTPEQCAESILHAFTAA